MKKLGILVLLLAVGCWAKSQALSLVHEVNFPFVTSTLGQVGSSDCWSYTDSLGVDYAIMGNSDHVAFVRASDGMVLDTVQLADQGDGYYHRGFRTRGHYCFAVSEMTGRRQGLAVIDIHFLPDSVHYVGSFDGNGTMIRSHNIDDDEGRPYLYLEADESLGQNGIEIFNITDPENPWKEGFVLIPNTHDMNTRNDTMWVAEGYSHAFSIYDVTDKGNPILIGRITNPNFGYAHSIWPSDDGKFFFTTEETPARTVKVWDAHDMNNIVQRGQYLSTNQLAHNVEVKGNFLFVSHYSAGTTVVDWSDPDNLREVGRYDTYPSGDPATYVACWGVCPFTANGYVYASNMNGKLFILNWDPNAVGMEESQPRISGQCWPNPLSQVTNIPLQLVSEAQIQVAVVDGQGALVEWVFEGKLSPGKYTLPWHPSPELSNGIYHIRIQSGSEYSHHKVVLQR